MERLGQLFPLFSPEKMVVQQERVSVPPRPPVKREPPRFFLDLDEVSDITNF
jgi:hypothetical protein